MIFLPVIFFLLAAATVVIGMFGVTTISLQAIQITAVAFIVLGVISYATRVNAEKKNRLQH